MDNTITEKIIEAKNESDVLDILDNLDPESVKDRCIKICKERGERLDKNDTYVFRDENFIIDYFSGGDRLIVSEKRNGGYKVLFLWEEGNIIKFEGIDIWYLILN